MHRPILLRFLPLVAVLSVSPQASAVITERASATYAWMPRQVLIVASDSGSVRISTWERDEVEVTTIKSAATRALLEKLQSRLEESPDSLRLEARPARFGWLTKAGRDARVDYEIRVPAALLRCVVRLKRGEANIEGLKGTVEFTGGIASLMTRDLRGNLTAATDIGRLDVGFTRLTDGQRIDARTRNGSIQLLVPATADAHLDAKAELSAIRCKIPVQVQRSDELVNQVLIGGWGDRAGKVILRSSKGAITIDRT